MGEWPELKQGYPGGQLPCWQDTPAQKGQKTEMMGETNALMRFPGKRYGFYPQDQEKHAILAWQCDSSCDFILDQFDKFAVPSFTGSVDEQNKQDWKDALQNIIDKFSPQLTNQKFLCGDQLMTADFAMAGIAFSYWKNPCHSGGLVYTSLSQDLIAKNQAFSEYLSRLEQELSCQLQNRKMAPF